MKEISFKMTKNSSFKNNFLHPLKMFIFWLHLPKYSSLLSDDVNVFLLFVLAVLIWQFKKYEKLFLLFQNILKCTFAKKTAKWTNFVSFPDSFKFLINSSANYAPISLKIDMWCSVNFFAIFGIFHDFLHAHIQKPLRRLTDKHIYTQMQRPEQILL